MFIQINLEDFLLFRRNVKGWINKEEHRNASIFSRQGSIRRYVNFLTVKKLGQELILVDKK